ncbi:N-6 DNA methylase [Marinomonas sp. IMCC 4694]|uniref:N-6 DNA methylase n=1 Tax=Marinomonas sp. IMCC 4694 TaxID=2605432 RepID=UPI0011E86254|nr:N-6 DNA methylase [Marinomonas sp. IMCC 4694]TYL47712.1 SAM-dependent DNA methyltransferase [Marinomonas sp. IMCC 4694]
MNCVAVWTPPAKIWQDNTLSSPKWKNDNGDLKAFDFAVANPPLSVKSTSNGINLADDEFNRFEYGTWRNLCPNGDFIVRP